MTTDSVKRLVRTISVRYWIALSLIAALSTTAFGFILYTAHMEEQRSAVVNLVGNQRTLSQRIPFFANAMARANSPLAREEYAAELSRSIRAMERAHLRLTMETDALGLPQRMEQALEAIYFEGDYTFDQQVRDFLGRASLLLARQNETISENDPDLQAINLAGSNYLLQTHDLIANLLGEDGERSIKRLERLEIAIWLMTLTLLVFELLVIFRPMAKQVGKTAGDLELARAEASEAAQAAQQAERTKSAFLATISHEIRTPLNSIIGLSQLLREARLSGEHGTHIERINQASEHLLLLLNDVLDFSKLEAGKLVLEPGPFDLQREIEVCVSILAVKASEKGLTVVTKCDPSLPVRIVGDSGRVRQVLMNLLSNAIKYTETGGISVIASLDPKGEDYVRIAVADTGVGIPRDRQQGLFREFEQIRRADRSHETGTGLGLAISKRIVEAMGGKIGLQSQEGVGSTFWFSVPLLKSCETPAPAAEGASAPSHGFGRPLSVLVAEDNTANQIVTRALLEKFGHSVEIANNGREALAALDRRAFDVVLMDVNMPVMDGLTATATIRDRTDGAARIPIIALTAHAFSEEHDRVMTAGMDDFLTKPIEPQRLALTLKRWGEATEPQKGAPPRLAEAGAPPIESSLDSVQTSLLDTAYLASMEEAVGPEAVAQMLQAAADNLKPSLQRLQEAAETSNTDDMAKAAHILRGTAGTIGAVTLMEAAEVAELAARAGEDPAIQDLLDLAVQTHTQLDDLIAVLRFRMEESPSQSGSAA